MWLRIESAEEQRRYCTNSQRHIRNEARHEVDEKS